MLEDIRLKELLQLENPAPYANLFTHVKEKKEFKYLGFTIKARDLNDMTFDDVVSIRQRLSKQLISFDDIIHVFKKIFPSRLPKWAYLRIRVTKFYPCYNYILNSVKKVADAEQTHWSPKHSDPDYKKSGSEILSKFAEMNVICEIAERYGMRPKDVLSWSYGEIFIEVARSVAQNDVQRNYYEIKASKHRK